MKTFLWTTLFWIIVAIAWLLCLGFGNLGTQVLDNDWMAGIMPKNLQTKICEPVVASAMDWIDWCAQAEENNCAPAVVEEETEAEVLPEETAWLQEPLSSIIANQEIIYNYVQESFETTQNMVNDLSITISQISQNDNVVTTVVDEREAQRLQLQAQIEALQNEMANL